MDGLDFSHSGAVHMELLATCIRILLFARFTIGPVALNAIRALPQFIGVDYVTPLHGDTLLHIAAMRSDAETTEGLLGDPCFTRTLAKNGFGLRAYEYASTPPILTLILEGAVRWLLHPADGLLCGMHVCIHNDRWAALRYACMYTQR